jgi:hypothetical protein
MFTCFSMPVILIASLSHLTRTKCGSFHQHNNPLYSPNSSVCAKQYLHKSTHCYRFDMARSVTIDKNIALDNMLHNKISHTPIASCLTRGSGWTTQYYRYTSSPFVKHWSSFHRNYFYE